MISATSFKIKTTSPGKMDLYIKGYTLTTNKYAEGCLHVKYFVCGEEELSVVTNQIVYTYSTWINTNKTIQNPNT